MLRYTLALLEEFGDRINAIFIRDVDPDETSEHDGLAVTAIKPFRAVGVPMYLVLDSIRTGEIAVDLGFVDADRGSRSEATGGR